MKILYSFDDSPIRNEKHVRYGVRILYTCLCFARASRVHIPPTIGTWPFRFPGSADPRFVVKRQLVRKAQWNGGPAQQRQLPSPNPTQPTICGQRTPQPRGTREMRSPNASVRRGALRPRQAQKWPRTPARGRARGWGWPDGVGCGAAVGLPGTVW